MKDFNSDVHVEEWMTENGGVEGLRRALARGAFAGQNKSLAAAWRLVYDKRQEEKASDFEHSLLERSVAASERSAESADRSATWAMWAALVALVAIIVAVVQNRYP